MEEIILLFSSLISCVIIVSLLFQFLNERYLKCYKNKYIYIALQIAGIGILTGVNMLMMPFLNMIAHVIIFSIMSYFFYFESNERKFVRVLETEILYIIIAITEALGVFILDAILNLSGSLPGFMIHKSIETAFSKLILLFLYYGISRVWNKNILRTKMQCVLYFIMFIYSICNVFIIVVMSNKENPVIMMLHVGSTIFANMYMLYFMKYFDEKNYYKFQLEMMELQQELYYENYEKQSEKYAEVMAVFHDIDKHIKVIEGLYQKESGREAAEYTMQLNRILHTIVPEQYSDNTILNCILTEKAKEAVKKDINFTVNLSMADLNFIKQVDITILFGNLIDNAMAACEKCKEKRYINVYGRNYKDMISIRVENSIEKAVNIKQGKIVSMTHNSHGIGLLNIQKCIDAYDGSIIYKNLENALVCDIVLNQCH